MSSPNVSVNSETSLSRPEPLHLFQATGIELEYMLVDQNTLDIAPGVDVVFDAYGAPGLSDIERGEIELSNELVRHVVEFKTAGPVPDIAGIEEPFVNEIRRFNELASREGWRLMPGAMHPWMDPATQMQLWPHDNGPVYEAYHRIFNCSGHGWSNLQSMHINLPFCGREEFARLHAAIRVLLPLLPALCASSPVADGQIRNQADYRIKVYRRNQSKIPQISGQVIPEAVFDQETYRQKILKPMFDAIAPFDTEGVLQEEWLNSRGAIARFDRNAIEIRLIDIQECPAADLAIASLVIKTLKKLSDPDITDQELLRNCDQQLLVDLLERTIADGEHAMIDQKEYLEIFGITPKKQRAGELWQNIFQEHLFIEKESRWIKPLTNILEYGTLSTRIRNSIGKGGRPELKEVYAMLCGCLDTNNMFIP